MTTQLKRCGFDEINVPSLELGIMLLKVPEYHDIELNLSFYTQTCMDMYTCMNRRADVIFKIFKKCIFSKLLLMPS